MANLFEILVGCGFSSNEAKTYLAVLQLGQTTINPIAKATGIPRTSIYNFIDALVARGVFRRTLVRGRAYYTAQPPQLLLEEQEQKLTRLRESLPLLNAVHNRATTRPRIHVFEGESEVKNIVAEEVNCQHEALYIWTGHEMMAMVGGTRRMSRIDKARIQKGVRIKTIRFKERDSKFETSKSGSKHLRELRWAPKGFPQHMGVGIYDTGKVGFFSTRREGFGLLIESKELEVLMRSLFEHVWKACSPALDGEG